MPDPLKGTKLGSAGSGSDVLSAHTHMISSTANPTSFGCTEADSMLALPLLVYG